MQNNSSIQDVFCLLSILIKINQPDCCVDCNEDKPTRLSCNEGCLSSWIKDCYCDKPCNVSECNNVL